MQQRQKHRRETWKEIPAISVLFWPVVIFVEHCLRECNRKLNNEGYIVFRRYGNKDIVLQFYTQLQPQETRLILHKCKKQADGIKNALLDYPHVADWLWSPREIPGANPDSVGRNTFKKMLNAYLISTLPIMTIYNIRSTFNPHLTRRWIMSYELVVHNEKMNCF